MTKQPAGSVSPRSKRVSEENSRKKGSDWGRCFVVDVWGHGWYGRHDEWAAWEAPAWWKAALELAWWAMDGMGSPPAMIIPGGIHPRRIMPMSSIPDAIFKKEHGCSRPVRLPEIPVMGGLPPMHKNLDERQCAQWFQLAKCGNSTKETAGWAIAPPSHCTTKKKNAIKRSLVQWNDTVKAKWPRTPLGDHGNGNLLSHRWFSTPSCSIVHHSPPLRFLRSWDIASLDGSIVELPGPLHHASGATDFELGEHDRPLGIANRPREAHPSCGGSDKSVCCAATRGCSCCCRNAAEALVLPSR